MYTYAYIYIYQHLRTYDERVNREPPHLLCDNLNLMEYDGRICWSPLQGAKKNHPMNRMPMTDPYVCMVY